MVMSSIVFCLCQKHLDEAIGSTQTSKTDTTRLASELKDLKKRYRASEAKVSIGFPFD